MVATNTDGTSGVMMGTGIDGRHAILIANPSLHNHRPGPMSVWADGYKLLTVDGKDEFERKGDTSFMALQAPEQWELIQDAITHSHKVVFESSFLEFTVVGSPLAFVQLSQTGMSSTIRRRAASTPTN